jgi:hypothetical protein
MPGRTLPIMLPVLVALAVATVTGAQEAERRGATPTVAAVDINRIDPLTFRAIATRIPQDQAPRIDGRLDDEAWLLGQASGNFVQREPHPGAPSSEPTEFRVLYDDRTLYFGVWAYDSNPGGIHATEMKRDSGLNKGDRIAIVIDTFFDRRNGFYFATNPLGAMKDAQYTDNSRVRNNDWNAVWECRTSRDGRGWYVEIAIPLGQLRFDERIAERTWGLNVARSIVRKNEETYWVPYARSQGVNGFAYLSNAGVLEGLRDVPASRRLEFVPFVAPQVGRDYQSGRSLSAADRFGFDARVGLTATLTADLTFRTDFAQVEADEEVVNVTRFSLFFPEKRQFFTESAGLFNYGKPGVESGDFGPGLLPLFYSRRIGLHDGREVPILGGGRVTGRVGPYSVGVLNLETGTASFTASTGQPLSFGRANYSVVRVKRDLFSQSTVGAIVLNRQGGPGAAYNRAAGFDFNWVINAEARFTTLLARTFSPGVSKGDVAAAFDFAYQRDAYNFDLTYLDVGEGFNAEMGYIRRTDVRNPRVKAAWTPRPGWKGVRQLSFGGLAEGYFGHDGRTESHTRQATAGVTFSDTSLLECELARDYDLLEEPWTLGRTTLGRGGYRWTTARVAYASSPRHRVAGSGYLEAGSYYGGDRTTASGTMTVIPRETLSIDLGYARNRIALPGAAPYVTNTVSTRLSYSFSPTLFAKAFVQYNDDRRLATLNLLLWSIYRPGSDLYIVYNEGWDTGLDGPRLAQVRNRSLAVKLTRWLSR